MYTYNPYNTPPVNTQGQLHIDAKITRRCMTITKLREEIASLKHEVRKLNSSRNELAPISRLPNEVLGEIFCHLVPQIPVNSSSSIRGNFGVCEKLSCFFPYDSIYSAVLVCRHWYKLIKRTPQIWRVVNLMDRPERVSEVLKLGKKVPLAFRLYSQRRPSALDSQLFQAVKTTFLNLHRVRYLELEIHHNLLTKLVDEPAFVGLEAPLLNTLIFADFPDANTKHTAIDLFSLAMFPQLQTLDLTSCSLNAAQSMFRPTLRCLILSSFLEPFSLDKFLDALKDMPLLETLRIESGSLYFEYEESRSNLPATKSPIQLRHLQTLSLFVEAFLGVNLLNHLSFPSTATILLSLPTMLPPTDASRLVSCIANKFAEVGLIGSTRPICSFAIHAMSSNSVNIECMIAAQADPSFPGGSDYPQISLWLTAEDISSLVLDICDSFAIPLEGTKALHIQDCGPCFNEPGHTDNRLPRAFVPSSQCYSRPYPEIASRVLELFMINSPQRTLLLPQLEMLILSRVKFGGSPLIPSFLPSFRNILQSRNEQSLTPLTVFIRQAINLDFGDVLDLRGKVGQLHCDDGVVLSETKLERLYVGGEDTSSSTSEEEFGSGTEDTDDDDSDDYSLPW